MKEPGGNLWWVYNPEDQSFSTLPTGPFLVPALIIATVFSLFRSWRDPKLVNFKQAAGKISESNEWQFKHARYRELSRRFVNDPDALDYTELSELRRLESYLYNPHGF
jgi:hypothetical protein